MYVDMPAAKGERVHIRIDDDIKEGAFAVVEVRGMVSLTNLVTHLLKEEINKEIKERPEMLADALKKVKAQASGIKQSVPVGSRANVANPNVNRRTQEEKTLAGKKRGRKR